LNLPVPARGAGPHKESALAIRKPTQEPESKLYRSISEVSEMLDVKPHVLRYWETQFSMLRPKKNRAGNRMYRPEEVRMLLRIKELLYDRRYTIAGARRTLLDDRKLDEPQVEIAFTEADRKLVLLEVKDELRTLLTRLRQREPVGNAAR
jgi:DNA-binding transcriptional MerR regulator